MMNHQDMLAHLAVRDAVERENERCITAAFSCTPCDITLGSEVRIGDTLVGTVTCVAVLSDGYVILAIREAPQK